MEQKERAKKHRHTSHCHPERSPSAEKSVKCPVSQMPNANRQTPNAKRQSQNADCKTRTVDLGNFVPLFNFSLCSMSSIYPKR